MPCAQSATRPQVVQPLEPRCVCRRCLARSGFGFLSRLERLSFVLQRNELSNTQSLPNRDSSNSFRWSLFDIGTILYSTRTHGSLRLHRYPGFPFGRASEFRSTLEVLHTSAFKLNSQAIHGECNRMHDARLQGTSFANWIRMRTPSDLGLQFDSRERDLLRFPWQLSAAFSLFFLCIPWD